jgi:hypothetical protein
MIDVSDSITQLLQLSVVIALGFLVAVAFYESLCNRDVLVGRTMRFARRTSKRRWIIGLTYVVSVGIGIPFLVLLWTVVLELSLVVVGSVDRLGNVALVSAAIVAATRILAYIREKTAHELAKAIPLSLAILLLTGATLNLEKNLNSLLAHPDASALTTEMIVFLLALEIGLRLLTDTSHAVLGSLRRRRGIDSDLGIWRTLVTLVKRPLASRAPDIADVPGVDTIPGVEDMEGVGE